MRAGRNLTCGSRAAFRVLIVLKARRVASSAQFVCTLAGQFAIRRNFPSNGRDFGFRFLGRPFLKSFSKRVAGASGQSRLLPIRTAPAVILTVHLRPVIAMGCLRTGGSVSDSEERGPRVQRNRKPGCFPLSFLDSRRLRRRAVPDTLSARSAGVADALAKSVLPESR